MQQPYPNMPILTPPQKDKTPGIVLITIGLFCMFFCFVLGFFSLGILWCIIPFTFIPIVIGATML